MAEGTSNQKPSAGDNSGEGGQPFYEAQRKTLQKLMDKKRKVAERLVRLHICTTTAFPLPGLPSN